MFATYGDKVDIKSNATIRSTGYYACGSNGTAGTFTLHGGTYYWNSSKKLAAGGVIDLRDSNNAIIYF